MPWKLASARQIAASDSAELARHRDRRQRVAHVVGAGEVQHHRQRAAAAGQRDVEARAAAVALERARAHVHALAQPVGHERPADARQDALHLLVVAAQHRQAVERQVVQELDEALLEALEVAAVRAEMIVVDVGDHRDHRLQMHERGVALVGLGDQVAARAQARIAAGALEPAADHEGRILATLGQHAGDQAGGGGLAVACRRPRSIRESASARRASRRAAPPACGAPARPALPGCRPAPRSIPRPRRRARCSRRDDRSGSLRRASPGARSSHWASDPIPARGSRD